MGWYVRQTRSDSGPHTDDEVLRAIKRGMPPTALLRHEDDEPDSWRRVRDVPPFAAVYAMRERKMLYLIAGTCAFVLCAVVGMYTFDPSRGHSAPARPPTADELRREAVARKEAEELSKLQAEEKAAKEKAAAEAVKRKQRDAELAAMSPAQRAAELKSECVVGDCSTSDAEQIIVSASDEKEQKSLRTKYEAGKAAREKERAKTEKKLAISDRERFASTFEKALFTKHMNPDDVTAVGVDKTTLRVEGWFCSRQFIYDFQHGDLAAQAAGYGFKRLECNNPLGAYWGEL